MWNKKVKGKLKAVLYRFLITYSLLTLSPVFIWGIFQINTPALPSEKTAGPSSNCSEQGTEAGGPSSAPESSRPQEFLAGFSAPGRQSTSEESAPLKGSDSFTLYDAATEEIFDIPEKEFLPAALACEMDVSAPPEALKAQAVAIATLYHWKQEHEAKVNEADFACDTENWLVYVSKAQMEHRWGEDFPQYYEQLESICQEVSGQLLTWEDSPIRSEYFAIAPGATESPQNLGEDQFPCLKAVASPGDLFFEGFSSTMSFPAKELERIFLEACPEMSFSFSAPPEDWFQAQELTPSGYTKSIELGGVSLAGSKVRDALSLRSSCFTVSCEENTFTFSVKGWGNGIGMSQAGAIFLAKQGAGYQEILAHYYPGAALSG